MQTEQAEKKGTESLEKLIDLSSKNIALGIKIAKDGVNEKDLIHLPEVFSNIQELVAFIAAKPEIAAEIKDLDVVEGIALLQKGLGKYKEIKDEVK